MLARNVQTTQVFGVLGECNNVMTSFQLMDFVEHIPHEPDESVA